MPPSTHLQGAHIVLESQIGVPQLGGRLWCGGIQRTLKQGTRIGNVAEACKKREGRTAAGLGASDMGATGWCASSGGSQSGGKHR